MNTSRPKRRWLQFRLRTLLALMLTAAVGCSWFAVKMRAKQRERAAVQQIERSGGRVLYDYEYDWVRSNLPNPVPPGPEWLRDILGDDFFAVVEGVRIGETQLGQEDWESIRGFDSLTRLWLFGCGVSDAELGQLKDLQNLRQLDLSYNPISESGIEHLAQLRSLRVLFLSGTQVTDRSLRGLETLPDLRILMAENIQWTGFDMDSLEESIPNCDIDTIGGTPIIAIEEATVDIERPQPPNLAIPTPAR